MIEIPLTRNQKTIIDKADETLIQKYRWFAIQGAAGRFYAATQIKKPDGRKHIVSMARLLFQAAPGQHTHYRDGNSLNNTRENIEFYPLGHAPRKYPAAHPKAYVGVYSQNKGHKRFRAMITVSGKTRYLGHFYTAEEAARVRDDAAFEVWGASARFNFPRPAQPLSNGVSRNEVPRKEEE